VRFRPQDFEKVAFKTIENLTAEAFGKRRKMIRQSLKNHMDKIETLGLDPTLRAENLQITDFVKLAALSA
jgi:16S rRNA (adenine1518-N6/adenine1519-N6)-dimethyltransferase